MILRMSPSTVLNTGAKKITNIMVPRSFYIFLVYGTSNGLQNDIGTHLGPCSMLTPPLPSLNLKHQYLVVAGVSNVELWTGLHISSWTRTDGFRL